MTLAGENVLLRIFVDTFKQWRHEPVYKAIVERARREHMAGVTVLEGIEGFSQNGALLKEHPWRLANNREVIVEIVDTREKVEAFLETIEPLLAGALVTLERAFVARDRTKEETP